MPRPSLEGQRVHVILKHTQLEKLRELAQRTGLTVAQHVRQAVTLYLSKLEKKP